MDIQEYYDEFEHRLTASLEELCRSKCALHSGQMPSSDDLDDKFNDMLREFLEEALPEYDRYPDVVLAWAGYVGMAVARWWDSDWELYKHEPYKSLHGKRGFDDMDEHITSVILGYPLDSKEAQDIASLLASCATFSISAIRHEGVEYGTKYAFFILVRTIYAMMRIGASIELDSLGYKFMAVH